MKIKHIIFSFVIISACRTNVEKSDDQSTVFEVDTTLNAIFDSANVEGSILIFDSKAKRYISNNYDRAKTGFLPASTFKIPNTLIGLETGIIKPGDKIFKWDGEPRRLKTWESDMDIRQAFKTSCVPCYQELARKVGVERMRQMLEKFNYGNMVFDSSSIDLFWLEGESKITQFQQINFLKRFYFNELPVKDSTNYYMRQIMFEEEVGGCKVSSKTGWAIRNEQNIGWYVGFLEKQNEVYFFAVNLQPNDDFNMDMFGMIRKQIAYKSFIKLGIMNE